MRCPSDHGNMKLKKMKKKITHRGVDVTVEYDSFECPICKLHAGTVATAGALQRAIMDAWRGIQMGE